MRALCLRRVGAGGELLEDALAQGAHLRWWGVELGEGSQHVAGAFGYRRALRHHSAGAVGELDEALAAAAFAALVAVLTVHLHDVERVMGASAIALPTP